MRRALPALFALGCGERISADATPVKVTRPSELIEASEMNEVSAAIAGTFSMPWWRDGPHQHPEVWSIDGGTLTRWDGAKEATAELVIVAPCLAKVKWPGGHFTYEEFVIDGETVWFGEEGGRTHGGRTVVCSSQGVWVLDDHGCRSWKPGVFAAHPSGLNPTDTSCAITEAGGFEADGTRWPKQGDVFVRADFAKRQPRPPERFASLADAKAALAR